MPQPKADELFEKHEDYYHGIRRDLLNLAPEIHGTVLEIGCADGLTLEYLKTISDCDLVGLDFCEKALEKVRQKGIEAHACDLNSEELPFSSEKFDYIIIGDVLEHLYDPWQALINISRTLKIDGTFLISIPNVKHYSLLKELILHDKWEYSCAGLLDSTHIRFFTLDGIKKLLSHSSLTPVKIEYNIIRSPLMRLINALCFNRLHSFMVFHYLVAARKIQSE